MIDQLIIGRQIPDFRERVRDDTGSEIFRFGGKLEAFHFDVLESVIGKPGFEDFRTFASGDEIVGLETADFAGVVSRRTFQKMLFNACSLDLTILNPFGIAKPDDLSLLKIGEFHAAPAGNVASNINDPGVRFFRRRHSDCRKFLYDHCAGEKGSGEYTAGRVNRFGFSERFLLETAVYDFTLPNTVVNDRTGDSIPALVG